VEADLFTTVKNGIVTKGKDYLATRSVAFFGKVLPPFTGVGIFSVFPDPDPLPFFIAAIVSISSCVKTTVY